MPGILGLRQISFLFFLSRPVFQEVCARLCVDLCLCVHMSMYLCVCVCVCVLVPKDSPGSGSFVQF